MRRFRTPTPSVAEAEAVLAAAKAEETAAAERRAEASKAHAAAVATLERDAKARVAAVERLVRDALAAVPDGRRPDLGARRVARGYLRGVLRPPELRRPESMVADVDEHAAQLLDAADHCAGVLDHLTRSTSVRLPGDHPLVARADDLEVRAWQAFIARVRVIAGEAS